MLENGRVRAGDEGLSQGHVLGGSNINIVVDKNENKSWTWRVRECTMVEQWGTVGG